MSHIFVFQMGRVHQEKSEKSEHRFDLVAEESLWALAVTHEVEAARVWRRKITSAGGYRSFHGGSSDGIGRAPPHETAQRALLLSW